MGLPARHLALSHRRQGHTIALGGFLAALSMLAGSIVARSDSGYSLPLIALLGVAGTLILLSLRPEILFLSWLALAPFLQESADASAVGRPLVLAFYLAPPLVFVLWTLTRPGTLFSPRLVDAMPAAYFLLVLGLLVLGGDASSVSVKAVYTTIGIGIVLYYFFAIGPIGSLSWESISAVLLVLCALEGLMSVVDGLIGWNLWHDAAWQEDTSLLHLHARSDHCDDCRLRPGAGQSGADTSARVWLTRARRNGPRSVLEPDLFIHAISRTGDEHEQRRGSPSHPRLVARRLSGTACLRLGTRFA
jgi:hypothetical protein